MFDAKEHHRSFDCRTSRKTCHAVITVATNMAGRGTDIVLGVMQTSLMPFVVPMKRCPRKRKRTSNQIIKRQLGSWTTTNVHEAGGLHIIVQNVTKVVALTISCADVLVVRATSTF